jgi:hypothetical protein
MWLRFIFIFLFNIIFIHNNVKGQIHVSKLGNDSNTGTIAQPLLTIQKALTIALPGETILIHAGIYFERIIPMTNGLPNAQITIQNFNNEVVEIDGAGVSGWGVFTFYGHQYFNIKGISFSINDTTAASWQSVVVIGKNSNHINFTNCSFLNVNAPHSNCIVLYGNDSLPVQNVVIDSCKFGNAERHTQNGIIITGQVLNSTVQNCSFNKIISAGIVVSGSTGTCPDSIKDFPNNILIKNNVLSEIYNLQPGSYQQGIAVDGAQNITIANNRISFCDFGINIGAYNINSRCKNILVKNNFIYQNYLAGLSMGVYDYNNLHGTLTNCNIINNTFYKNDALKTGTGELNLFPFNYSSITNNILYCNESNKMGNAYFYDSILIGNSMDYNLWCNPALNPSLASFWWNGTNCNSYGFYKMITGFDAHSLFEDPIFYNEHTSPPNIHLVNYSSAINAGNPATMVIAGDFDIDKQLRKNGQNVDIGCDENYGEYNEVAPLVLGTSNVSALVNIFPNPSLNGNFFIETTNKFELLSITNTMGQLINFSIKNNLISIKNYNGIALIKLKIKNKTVCYRINCVAN